MVTVSTTQSVIDQANLDLVDLASDPNANPNPKANPNHNSNPNPNPNWKAALQLKEAAEERFRAEEKRCLFLETEIDELSKLIDQKELAADEAAQSAREANLD